ncbi:MAG: cupin domain-containing protein [Parvibaculaceae bacterium]|nr:cupin domain-containing protein [Parvibaculaceae bacterium]
MLSETLIDGLDEYRIGHSVRALRKHKGLSLSELGKHTSLSGAMISKVERGDVFPTLPTLLRIAMVFGVGLDHFFVEAANSAKIAIMRKEDRVRLPNEPGETSPTYSFESLDYGANNRTMDNFLAVFQSGANPTDPHAHDGDEHIFVISGQLTLFIDNRKTMLETGDAVYFDSSLEHAYAAGQDEDCTAKVTVTPSIEQPRGQRDSSYHSLT